MHTVSYHIFVFFPPYLQNIYTACFPFMTKHLRPYSPEQSCINVQCQRCSILLDARGHVHYTQNQNITLKIRFCYTQALWRTGSSELRVMPSKLVNRGWKYPVKNEGGGRGSPLKERKWGALYCSCDGLPGVWFCWYDAFLYFKYEFAEHLFCLLHL